MVCSILVFCDCSSPRGIFSKTKDICPDLYSTKLASGKQAVAFRNEDAVVAVWLPNPAPAPAPTTAAASTMPMPT